MGRRLGPAGWSAIGLQTLLFVVAIVLVFFAVADVSGGAGFPTAAGPILAVLVAGAVRAVRGVCGGRALLIAADVGLVLGGLAVVSQAGSDSMRGDLPVSALVVGVGIAAAVTTPWLPAGTTGTIHRTTARLFLPAGLLVVDVASLAVIVTGQPLAPDAVVVIVVGVLLADAVALIAWWFGARWAIGIQALTTAGVWLASLVAYPESMATAGVQLLLAAAYVFLGAVAFVSGPGLTVPADDPAARDDDLPLPARLWLAIAAVLYPFLLLPASGFGTSDFCRGCIPHTTVDDALLTFQGLCVLAIPFFALVAVGTGGRMPGRRIFGWVLIVTSAILTATVVSGLAGNQYFGWAGYTMGPVALVGAAGILAARPALGARTGWAASLAAGFVGLAWMWAVAAPLIFFASGPNAIGALPAGFALPLAIAWEASRVRGRSDVSTIDTAHAELVLDTTSPSA